MTLIYQIIVAIVMMIVSYLLTPKPKIDSGTDAGSLDDPKASAGSPIKKVFGTMTIKDPNVLWYGDKSTHTFSKKG